MCFLRRQIVIGLALFFGCHCAFGQAAPPSKGALIVVGKAKGAKTQTLKKTRFYLFRGTREANKPLIEKLKAANVTSRDCFYCRLKASAELMEWLKMGDCESVHCREITSEDIAKVPEFKAAYAEGLKRFRKKPVLARRWLVTSLERGFRSGIYIDRKKLVRDFRRDIVQIGMTDNSNAALAYFSGIPLEGETEKFVYTNLVPFEFGEKSYVWVCEVDVGKEAKKTPVLDMPDTSKVVKKCEVIVRDLPVCKPGMCEQK